MSFLGCVPVLPPLLSWWGLGVWGGEEYCEESGESVDTLLPSGLGPSFLWPALKATLLGPERPLEDGLLEGPFLRSAVLFRLPLALHVLLLLLPPPATHVLQEL